LNGFRKWLLDSLIYKVSGKKNEELISLIWKMELNKNATTHLANKEIVIPTTIALDHPKTRPGAFTCSTHN